MNTPDNRHADMNSTNTTTRTNAAHAYLAVTTVFAVSLFSTAAYAEWTGGIEGGTRKSDSETVTELKFKAVNNDKPLSHSVYASWLRGEKKSAYELGYKPSYWFNDFIYGFGEGTYTTSTAENIDNTTELFGGVGIQLIQTDSQELYAEAGTGQVTVNGKLADGSDLSDKQNYSAARARAKQVISDLVKLEITGDYRTAEKIDTTELNAGIAFRVAQGALKYTYRIIKNDANGVKTDSDESIVSFEYSF